MGRNIKLSKVEPVEKRWLSTQEAAAYLGISEESLQKLRNERRIVFAQDERKLYHEKISLDRYVMRHVVVRESQVKI